jgi:DegV family protein with EDD domain
MKRIIAADSSCDLARAGFSDIVFAPLKIRTAEREFADDENLNVEEMIKYLESYKGKSGTACPNIAEFYQAFSDADEVFCVTITSNLSGSFNSARIAAQSYESECGKRAYAIDTLSVGPESALIIEKIRELWESGEDFDSVKEKITEYNNKTRLIFSLESMKNLANNGRVSHIAAKMAGILGIRAIGRASDVGTLEMTDKVRGEANTIATIYKNMLGEGYLGGRVRIHHVQNQGAATRLFEMIKKDYPNADISLLEARGLCSFYAERGGLLVGFET